jgi:aspartate/glutamate racemase
MSEKVEPSFMIRELKLDDCEQVTNICTEVKFVVAKYNNEIMMKVDPKAILVAQDIKTGKIISTQSTIFLEIYNLFFLCN